MNSVFSQEREFLAADKVAFKVEPMVKECPEDKLKKMGLNGLSFMELGMSTYDINTHNINSAMSDLGHEANADNLELDDINTDNQIGNLKDINDINGTDDLNFDLSSNKVNKKSNDELSSDGSNDIINNIKNASDPLDQAEELLSTKSNNNFKQLNNLNINSSINDLDNINENTINNSNIDNIASDLSNMETNDSK